MNRANLLLFLLIVLTFNSCSLNRVVTEQPYIYWPKPDISMDTLGNGIVLFHNSNYIFDYFSALGPNKVNIKMDGVHLGQIDYGEFFMLEIEPGEHEFELEHRDMFMFRSSHKLMIDNDTKVILVKPTVTSNKIEITNKLPDVRYLRPVYYE